MERKDLLSLNFYNKSECFWGSEKGIRYKVEKFTEPADTEDDDGTKKEPLLKVTLWPEPFNFDNTPDEQKQTALFPFSEEGLLSVTDHINNGLTV